MTCPSCLAGNQAGARFCFACGAPLDPSLASLASGALFAGRYEILGPLGRGGMGMVYRALDNELGETVAIKVLRPDVARESNGRVEQRFRSEIRLARRVRHRNVCSVYGDGEDRGLLYICMEHVEGENLARPVREDGGLPPDEAWDVALQVARGLEAIHEVGIVHRDLKTANLMRDRRGVVRVMDFGIAKQHNQSDSAVTVTATGALMGTPEYMSPEQLRGGEVDFRSDLYSLAIVVYELFTGDLPLRGETPVATIVRQLQEAPGFDAPGLPPALRPVLERALCKSPAERYATATEMRQALEEARLAPEESKAAAPGPTAEEGAVPPAREAPPRVPLLRILGAQLAVVALAVHLVGAGGPGGAGGSPAPAPRADASAADPAAAPPALPAAPGPPSSTPAPPARRVAARPSALVPAPPPARRLAPAVDASRVYDEAEVDVKPRRVRGGVSTPYPEWARDLKRGRRVSILASYVVTETGDVTDIRVEEGGGALDAVLLEVSRWKYQPGTKDGMPVKVRVRWRHTYIG